ncbi:MAG: transglycosylase SLT domain-containing protein [Candidatus Krumholzibacteriia bacterium]
MTLPGLDLQSSVLVTARGDDALAAARQGARAAGDRAGLEKVARQFEALFYNQLLRSMRDTVPDNGFWGESSGGKIYRQLHDQELAGRMADQGGLGIADLIVRQFAASAQREQGADPPAPVGLPARQRRALTQYRQLEGQPSDLVRLRHLARHEGGAVADTLGRFEKDLVAAARQNGLDPALVLAVAVRESAGDPGAVSDRGARGLMQLMPTTAREMGVADPHDPAQNLQGGARYLARMLERYGGDVDLALAAYNAGPGNVDRAGGAVPPFAETRAYVARVRELAARLGAPAGTNLDKDPPDTTTPTSEAR